MSKLNKLINECNAKRVGIYYNLSQLTTLTGLSPRMLKYRIKKVKSKYVDTPTLLSKVGRSWRIHYTIIHEFLPIRTHKSRTTLTNFKWNTMATWSMKSNYTLSYHDQLIKEVSDAMIKHSIYYTIELDKRGCPHVHLVSDAPQTTIQQAIKRVLDTYLSPKEYRLLVSQIDNKPSVIGYLKKAPISNGFNKTK